jgi:hypothetical protein
MRKLWRENPGLDRYEKDTAHLIELSGQVWALTEKGGLFDATTA